MNTKKYLFPLVVTLVLLVSSFGRSDSLGFSPGDLDGLILLMDADAVGTMQIDQNTGQVLAWHDKSEFRHEAIVVEGSEPPTHIPDALNGRGVIRFDGRNAFLLDDSEVLDFAGTDDVTFFAVLNSRSNGSILGRTSGNSMQYRFHVPTERTLRVTFGRGGEHADTKSIIAGYDFSLLSVVNEEADGIRKFSIYFDGELEKVGLAGTGRVNARTVIGARGEGLTQPLSFDLAKLILYDRALSRPEREQVEQYLVDRFALNERNKAGFQLDDAPEGTFTLAVIPDTQRYHGTGAAGDQSGEPRNPSFDSRTIWLADNLDSQRIVFVSHVGDIVDRNNDYQWQVARNNMDRLHSRVPYGISVGNHDMEPRTGDSTLFQKYFGAERYQDKEWYGGTYSGRPGHAPAISGNNANSYQFFSSGGLDFIIVHVECNAPDDVLEWVDEVLEANRDRMAIITTHMYLGGLSRRGANQPQGRMEWKKVHGDRGNTAQEMWDKSFRHHENLFLVLCGDQAASITHNQQSYGANGNVVYEVLQDYPRHDDESDWLRLFRFNPEAMLIEVYTYSPAQGRLCDGISHVNSPQDHQFELDISEAISRHKSTRKSQMR